MWLQSYGSILLLKHFRVFTLKQSDLGHLKLKQSDFVTNVNWVAACESSFNFREHATCPHLLFVVSTVIFYLTFPLSSNINGHMNVAS